MRQNWWLGLNTHRVVAALALLVPVLLGWQPITRVASWFEGTRPTIRLGLLHSQTGNLAISEKSLLDAEVLAIEEIDAAGGVAGRQIVWSAPDCWRNRPVFIAAIRKAGDRLGWSPRVSTLDGVARLLAWIGENRGLFTV